MRQLCVRRVDGLAERGGEAAGDRGRRLHGDLLAENCASRQLESVEGAGNAEAWPGGNGAGEHGVAREMSGNEIGKRVQVEEMAQTLEERSLCQGKRGRALHEQR